MKVQTVIDFTHEDIRRMVEQAAREQMPSGGGTMKIEFESASTLSTSGQGGRQITQVTAQVSVESMAPRNQVKARSPGVDSRSGYHQSVTSRPQDGEVSAISPDPLCAGQEH